MYYTVVEVLESVAAVSSTDFKEETKVALGCFMEDQYEDCAAMTFRIVVAALGGMVLAS